MSPLQSPLQSGLWVKICGLTQAPQAIAVAEHGASAIGFIGVAKSPRYVTPEQIQVISQALIAAGHAQVARVGVFADADIEDVATASAIAQLTTVQLHGQESPAWCAALRQRMPHLGLMKAFRIRDRDDLAAIAAYESSVDAVLLDAYHPHLLGGTGHTLDWGTLQRFRPSVPWILAGGLTPENVGTALTSTAPNGIDLSSGVEIRPGDKDLDKVRRLFEALGHCDRVGRVE